MPDRDINESTVGVSPTRETPGDRTPQRDAFLDINGVFHRYGRVDVLKGVSLEVPRGEVLGLLGPSGCGKSTLLRLIAGVEDLQAGHIALEGRELAGPTAHIRPEHRAIGLLPQDYALFPHLTVLDNVGFGVRQSSSADRHRIAMETLAMCGMAAFASSFPHQLSGGEQQRVALARALAPRPNLLLLDEPFANLDIRLRGRLREETLQLLKSLGLTAVIVTHDAEEAMALGDRIALMDQGRVRQIGSPSSLYRAPESPFVAAFFGELNRFPCQVILGQAVTPFGAVPAPGWSDGETVHIFIRPESIAIEERADMHNAAATLLSSRFLGRFSRVTARLQLPRGDDLDLVVLVAGHKPLTPGADVYLRCAIDDILVFAP